MHQMHRLYTICTLTAAYFLVIANVTIVATLLPFIEREVGITAAQRVVLLSVFPILSVPINLAIGPLVDGFDKRRVMLAGSILTAADFVAAGLVTDVNAQATLRGVAALFLSMISLTIFSSVPEHFDESERVKVTGFVASGSSLAQLIAIPASVFIAAHFGWRISFFAAAGYSALLCIAVTFIPAPRFPTITATRDGITGYFLGLTKIARSSTFAAPLIGYGFFACAFFVFFGMYPTWLFAVVAHTQSENIAALVFVAGGLGGLFGALLAGIIGERFGSSFRGCALLCIVSSITLLPLPVFQQIVFVQFAVLLVLFMARGVFLPVYISNAMAVAESGQRGGTQGVIAAVFQTATAIGAAVAATLYSIDDSFITNIAVSAAFFIAASLLFAGIKTRAGTV